MISLDNRLRSVFNLFPSCRLAADIGADHGKLALALVTQGKAERIMVTDISRDSLRKAEDLFAAHHASHLAEFLLGDGMTVLPRTPDAVSVCGMGGKTISGILENGLRRIFGAELILSPHTEIPAVRRTVYRLGYHIADERCAVASRRFYIMITAKPGQEKISEEETELGPCLYRHRDDPAVREYYLWRHKVLSVERNETSEKKARWYFEAL